MSQDNIADPTRPSAGRMYDYVLGGSHNFEVDRQAAEQVMKIVPFSAKYARLQRWALKDIATELGERRGYDVIIDFASGLPTNDHIHYNVPKETTVIYSDNDPIVVEYAREILQGTPNVYFFQGDARKPEELLNLPEVEKALAGRRKIAFVYWGVSTFLDDEGLRHAVQCIYDWAAPGSCLAFNAQGVFNKEDPDLIRVMDIYAKMGTPWYVRSLDEYCRLLGSWKLEKEGFISLLDWHGFDQSDLGKENVKIFGPMGGGHGAYLTK